MARAESRLAELDASEIAGTKGVYLELFTRPEWFVPEKFERPNSGIRLASAIELDDGRLRATVFVPHDAFAYFHSTLEQYRSEMGRGGKRPANADRVERIEAIDFGEDLRSLWTDPQAWFPEDVDSSIWWEVWLFDTRADGFISAAERFGVVLGAVELTYPGLVVRLVRATRSALEHLNRHAAAISELRRPTSNPRLITKLAPVEQGQLIDDFSSRIAEPDEKAPAVCVLDTGVNQGHPLLSKALRESDCLAWDGSTDVADNDDHGTPMCGTVLYGDLTEHLTSGSIPLVRNRLESVKIFSRHYTGADPTLYGAVIRDAVNEIESLNKDRRRIFVSAIYSGAEDNQGLPSEWSSEMDRMAAEEDRLFIVAAGNVDDGRAQVSGYPAINDLHALHDPGQSWNALVVGGFTERTQSLPEPFEDFLPLAPTGALSPTSSTSVAWTRKKAVPTKPDVVFEAGNYAYAPGAEDAMMVDDYESIAPSAFFRTTPLSPFAYTSAATADVGRIAGAIAANEPDLWPETIRALIVHSAQWTTYMLGELDACKTEAERITFLRRYGYGVPSLSRALHSARNDVTLIAQGTLRPYRRDGDIKTDEAVQYQLPWPTAVLEELGETELEVKVTLSYFVDPNPGRRGWLNRYSYASHGLRFKMKRADESAQQYRERINRAERDEEEAYGGAEGEDQWRLGRCRDRGSLHADIWRGRAADLARSTLTTIVPISGWWRYQPRLGRWDREVRYALIVGLRAAGLDIDIYTAIENTIPTVVATEIELE